MLLVGFSVTTVLCVLLSGICYLLGRRLVYNNKSDRAYRDALMEEKQSLQHFVSGIVQILDSSVGGLSKRLSESQEIVETISRLDPELFKRDKGLIYWLHANDQFLVQLAKAAVDGVDRDQQQSVHRQMQADRDDVFCRAYANSGLRPPA
jgi:hypothetical protein